MFRKSKISTDTSQDKAKRHYTYARVNKQALRNDLRWHSSAIIMLIALLLSTLFLNMLAKAAVFIMYLGLMYSPFGLVLGVLFIPLVIWGIVSLCAYIVAEYATVQQSYSRQLATCVCACISPPIIIALLIVF